LGRVRQRLDGLGDGNRPPLRNTPTWTPCPDSAPGACWPAIVSSNWSRRRSRIAAAACIRTTRWPRSGTPWWSSPASPTAACWSNASTATPTAPGCTSSRLAASSQARTPAPPEPASW